MRKIPFSVSAVALALLAGCVSEPVTPVPVVAAPAVVAAPTATVVAPAPAVVAVPQAVVTPGAVVVPAAGVRPGMGRVESSQRLGVGADARPVQRVGLRMDDGTVQFVDTPAANLAVGDRIELTADSHIRYPIPR